MHRVPPAELGRDREEIFAYPAWRFHDAAGDVAEHPGIVYGLQPEAYYRLVYRNGKLIGSNFFGDNGSAGAVKTTTEGVQIVECRSVLEKSRNLMVWLQGTAV